MKYTESHEWIEVKDAEAVVGITVFAQRELGEVVSIELPLIGKQVKEGEEVAVLESTKAAADIYAPVSGEITAVNETLRETLSPLNHAPEKEGWLFKLKLTQPEEIDLLLDKESYLAMISG